MIAAPHLGTVNEARQDELCRSKAKSGTTHFFPYDAAHVVLRGRRSTLGIYRVRAKEAVDRVVRTLLERLGTLGFRVKLLLPDRGSYSALVIHDLIMCQLPFIMPAVKRGKKPTALCGPAGTRCSG